eukprot:1143859-Pelagomonas_calceolata.AAC.2
MCPSFETKPHLPEHLTLRQPPPSPARAGERSRLSIGERGAAGAQRGSGTAQKRQPGSCLGLFHPAPGPRVHALGGMRPGAAHTCAQPDMSIHEQNRCLLVSEVP